MATNKAGTSVPEHPLLRILQPHAPKAKMFCGYVGSANSSDHIRLYANLYDLSQCVEIRRADVLHVEEAPAHLLPFGGSVLWLDSDAAVVRHRQESVADVYGAATQRRQESAADVYGVTAPLPSEGRLRITRRQRPESAEDCHSPCQPCHSPCGICTSPPE
ncbi:hypothetical protein O7599_30200 [Streptomyces sp. WMMC500]|uniref:hypothetical protein n=1 Tax=Streptomyces sp. WMMC500 TaxID=3015154 RepID=UPI00248BAFF7|nr:hypothetical protein [Streptomyces sp. WMMC500]WBB59780.1 hypothetical protein O7599_30200 [Streptomyces sp. WMMC500]